MINTSMSAGPMSHGQRLRFWLTCLLALAVLLYVLRGVLLPFVAGLVIAYFLDPLAGRLERVGLSRLSATALITVFFFSIVGSVVVILAPLLEDQVVSFVHRVPDYAASLQSRLAPLLEEAKRHLSNHQIEQLQSSLGDYAGTMARWGLDVMQSLLTGGLAIVNLLSLLFITPVVTFYMLRDWHRMKGKVDSWLPRHHADTIHQQLSEINRTLSGFLRGQATVCLILGAYYGLGLSLVGLDLGLVLGLGSGLFSFIPYLGCITGFLASVGLAFMQTHQWDLPLMVCGVFAVGQVLEGNFLTPNLVGDKVGLHPVWIMFALLASGTLLGFVGVLTAAVIGVLVRFSLGRYLNSSLYQGQAES